jgi:hypothetical protein
MSTYFRPTGRVPLEGIKKKCKITKVVENPESHNNESFFDGDNWLHFTTNGEGDVIDIFRYGNNNSEPMLDELERIFNVRMISEYEEEYQELFDPESGVITIQLTEE